MDYKVTLSSELGTEEFEYSSRVQANEGFDRLVKSCKAHYAKDKIVRHLAILSVSRVATIGEETIGEDIDVSHLDAHAWGLLSDGRPAQLAAQAMAEALEQAAYNVRDNDMSVTEAFDDIVEPVLERYKKFGGNDTEPRAVARTFLNSIKELAV